MSDETPREVEVKVKGKVKDWRTLAEEAAKETNPAKLSRLVEELCIALDAPERSGKKKPEQSSKGEVA